MFNNITCPNCLISFIDLDNNQYVVCPTCGHNLKMVPLTENITTSCNLEVLKIGDVVQITNTEHVWHNMFAIICDIKPKFCRIEAMDRKVWIPQHWVKIDEPDNIN